MAPKKRSLKGSRKKVEAQAAKLEAERLAKEAEFEAQKRRLAEERERERKFKARIDELDDRENALKERARKIDDEVASRSARLVKEAEAREASSEKRVRVREASLANAESRYADGECDLQMRLVEVKAREAALGDGVVGGIAERLEKMLEEQMDVRDVALSRSKQIEAARCELELKEAALLESIAHKEAALARAEESASDRISDKERKLTQQDFTLKRRLGRRIKEAEALCEAHRAECSVRDRRFKAREEEIRRRSRELQLLLRKVRKLDRQAENERPQQNVISPPFQTSTDDYYLEQQHEGQPQRPQRPSTAPSVRRPAPQDQESYQQGTPLMDVSATYGRASEPPRTFYRPSTAPSEAPRAGPTDVERARDDQAVKASIATNDQFKALIRHVHAMEDDLVDELKRHHQPQVEDDDSEGDVNAIRDVNAAERLVMCAEGLASQQPPDQQRPFAARHLPPKAGDDIDIEAWAAVAAGPSPAPPIVIGRFKETTSQSVLDDDDDDF